METIIRTIEPTKYIALLRVNPDFTIGSTKYPNWFHRTMIRLMFGWKYERIE